MSPLTLLILVPLAAAAVVLCLPREGRAIRPVTIGAAAVTLVVALAVLAAFDAAPAGRGGYRFIQQVPWAPSLGLNYFVGVDGINLGLLVMTAMVAFAAACLTGEIRERTKEYHFLLLVMTAGVLGTFASLDLLFFYAFHELALVPTFLMIGIWGRGRDRGYAAFQVTLYLTLGALIALVGLIALYFQVPADARTFDLVALTEQIRGQPLPARAQLVIFPLLLFGFGILVALWPFHTWAPLGYAAAPTATAMLHAGALKKFGLYGLIRVALPLLPDGSRPWLEVLAWLCLGNILYCGLVALRQRDLNRLIGNSSVAHMGFAFLGIASLGVIGITGTVMVMVAHGLLAALSFGLSGWIHGRAGTLELDRFGGLLRQAPFIGSALLMAMLAGCGLPGFGNFVGEVLVLFGAWEGLPGFVAAACWGALVIAAVYALRAVRVMLHGSPCEGGAALPDAGSPWARLPFLVLLAGLVGLGCWPRVLTGRIAASAAPLIEMAQRAAPPAPAAEARPAPAGPRVAAQGR